MLGYLDVRVEETGIRLNPHVALGWGKLAAFLQWRGRRLRIEATAEPRTVEVAVQSGESIRIAVGDGEWRDVPGGGQLTVP